MKRSTILIILAIILSTIQSNAQKFNPYLTLGFNLTHDYLTETGNSQVGSRMGLNTGIGISVAVNKRWETNMELSYSQNGFYVNFVQVPTLALNKMTLHYVEVPLTFAYRFNIKNNEGERFYKRSIGGGITYARLFRHKVVATDGTDVSDELRFDRLNSLLFNFSATSFFNKSFALNGRGTLSMFGEWTIALRFLYYFYNK
ncbi:MAG: porin family protein [Saprospiraceae bacterium]